jgi:hypothetical protein
MESKTISAIKDLLSPADYEEFKNYVKSELPDVRKVEEKLARVSDENSGLRKSLQNLVLHANRVARYWDVPNALVPEEKPSSNGNGHAPLNRGKAKIIQSSKDDIELRRMAILKCFALGKVTIDKVVGFLNFYYPEFANDPARKVLVGPGKQTKLMRDIRNDVSVLRENGCIGWSDGELVWINGVTADFKNHRRRVRR